MSGVWDRGEAATFVETLFGKHHTEIYAYLLRTGSLANAQGLRASTY